MSSQSQSQSQPSNRGGRGEGGRGRGASRGGRGRGGGRRPGGGRGGRGNKRNGGRNNNNHSPKKSSFSSSTSAGGVADEDILIEFMPYLKNGNEQAIHIHQLYQNDQRYFVREARTFLQQQKEEQPSNQSNNEDGTTPNNRKTMTKRKPHKKEKGGVPPTMTTQEEAEERIVPPVSPGPPPVLQSSSSPAVVAPTPPIGATSPITPFPTPSNITTTTHMNLVASSQHQQQHQHHTAGSTSVPQQPQQHRLQITDLKDRLDRLVVGDNNNNNTNMSPPSQPPLYLSQEQEQEQLPPIGVAPMADATTTGPPQASSSLSSLPLPLVSLSSNNNSSNIPLQPNTFVGHNTTSLPPTVAAAIGQGAIGNNRSLPPGLPPLVSSSIALPTNTNSLPPMISSLPPPLPHQPTISSSLQPASTGGRTTPLACPPGLGTMQTLNDKTTTTTMTSTREDETLPSISTTTTVPKEVEEEAKDDKPKPESPPTVVVKKEYVPKRLWSRLQEQPGRLLANDISPFIDTKSIHNNSKMDGSGGKRSSNVDDVHQNTRVVVLRPRKELTAKWMLPLSYLNQRYTDKQKTVHSIQEALEGLSVGLFRRGCTENGTSNSIISKDIIAPRETKDTDTNNSGKQQQQQQQQQQNYPFHIDHQSKTVWGTVPFYSPRTPGHVVLRLYWADEPLYTLATGPTLFIQCSSNDVEPTLRFILSNFKSKHRNNTTSLSSLHSLASVLSQFAPDPNASSNQQQQHHHHNRHHNNYHDSNNRWDGAGRATWGCICESKKVLEACGTEYLKQKEKLEKIKEEVDDLEQQVLLLEEQQQQEEIGNTNDVNNGSSNKNTAQDDRGGTDNGQDGDEEENEPTLQETYRDKKNFYMKHMASNERRWKDSQMAFAAILKAILNNRSANLLLKQDLLVKLRLEYDLYCSFCEAFAPSPFAERGTSGDGNNNDDVTFVVVDSSKFPYPITQEHFRACAQSRMTMQVETLGFVPNEKLLQSIVMPTVEGGGGGGNHHLAHRNKNQAPTPSPNKPPKMDRDAVGTFNRLSQSMCQLYQEVYMTSDQIHREREMVRARIESIVSQCDAFPPGTRVVVFGSAANGFGSPSSDLDMCLQLPPNTKLARNDDEEEDSNGSLAMAKLAQLFETSGMKDVDTGRLTARIPVVMFNCPRPMPNPGDGDDAVLECDLSMQNPLACLNTSLLKTYSNINSTTSVLAAIIKRWAKARDINNPSRHTLSSYGYILMLLHFLTYHRPTPLGLTETVEKRQRDTRQQQQQAAPPRPPLLPNLQWMDGQWPHEQPGTPYRELMARPRNMIPHPSDDSNFSVNTYFYRLTNQATLMNLRHKFPGNELSVAILLASFFRYYAYEFDYKKYVVSLHSTATHGLVERENKAENDCWKVHFQGLAIEDPFETFYDVAHVVKGGNFHQLRNEFALAYSKIVDAAASGNQQQPGDAIAWHDQNLHNMSGKDLIDWICEPVETDKEN